MVAGYSIASGLLGRLGLGAKSAFTGGKGFMQSARSLVGAGPGALKAAFSTNKALTGAYTAGGLAMWGLTGDPGWGLAGFGMGVGAGVAGRNIWGTWRTAFGLGAGILTQNPLATPITSGAMGAIKGGFGGAMRSQGLTKGQYWGGVVGDVGRYYKGMFQGLTGQTRRGLTTWANIRSPYLMGPLAFGTSLAIPRVAMDLAMGPPSPMAGLFPGGVSHATPGGGPRSNPLNTMGLSLAMHKNRHGGTRIM